MLENLDMLLDKPIASALLHHEYVSFALDLGSARHVGVRFSVKSAKSTTRKIDPCYRFQIPRRARSRLKESKELWSRCRHHVLIRNFPARDGI